MIEKNEHWNKAYSQKSDSQLGWFESDVSQTLKFLNTIQQVQQARIFLPGAGTSLLVEELLARGCELILNDVSTTALDRLKARVGMDSATWLIHDVSLPLPSHISDIDVWIDRAVLHFLTNDDEIKSYFENVKSSVVDGGYVLLAEFAENGHERCAGLDVHRYSIDEMSSRLGEQFALTTYEHIEFKMPSGDTRLYLYALYRKIK